MSSLNPRPSFGRRHLEWTAGLTILLALATLMAPAAAKAQERVEDRTAERIVLEVDGRTFARFAEISGLEAAGGGATTSKKWANITLKRGTTDGGALRRWHDAGRTRNGAGARKGGSIVVYDTMGRPVRRYRFTNAWPKKLELGSPRARGSQTLESVTLEYETIQRVAP